MGNNFGTVTYTVEQKAEALVRLKMNNGNIAKTARELKLNRHTLKAWSESKDPELLEKVTGRTQNVVKSIEDELTKIYEQLPSKRKDATYMHLVSSIKILTHELRLVQGLPTYIVSLTPSLVIAANRANVNLESALRELLSVLIKRGDAKTLDVHILPANTDDEDKQLESDEYDEYSDSYDEGEIV